MTEHPECAHLPGRLRDICRGHDDDGNPVLTPEKCRQYRERWGIGRDVPQPTIMQMAMSFSAAFARHALGGFKECGGDEQELRRTICLGCDRLDHEKNRCKECGCNLARKIPWLNESCPLGKWGVANGS